ncbi:Bidirectional sugar transporter SWEET14 [Hordeum vulgare]|nr:Bidirectional sugar transporter SWEET14 [Hordeum vulgare]
MWVKPSHGLVKINVDATFHEDTLSGACGAVVRDDHGDFVAPTNWFIPHVRNAESTEFQAIRNGLYLASNIGCNSVEIESDCISTVEAIQSMDEYMGADVVLVLECKQMAMDFTRICYEHCFREANKVADSLARYSFDSRSSGLWENSTPDFISVLFVNDMTIL